MQWETESRLSRQVLAIRQTILVVFLSFSLVYLFVLGLQYFDGYLTVPTFWVITQGFLYILLFMFFLTIMAFTLFFRSYQYHYKMDDEGITSSAGRKQSKKNSLLNRLLLLAAFFSRSPSAAGTAGLAQSRQSMKVKWKDINMVEENRRQRVINLKRNKRTLLDVHCNPDNYEVVLESIRSYVSKRRPDQG